MSVTAELFKACAVDPVDALGHGSRDYLDLVVKLVRLIYTTTDYMFFVQIYALFRPT